jgi:hypothetical protein
MNRIENDATNNSSVVPYVFVAARMYLLSSCLAMMGEGIHSDTDQVKHGDNFTFTYTYTII